MMKSKLFPRLVLLSLILLLPYGAGAQEAVPVGTLAPPTTAKVSVYFSPRGGAQDAIIREIDAAKQSIRIQAYSYTSEPISQAVLRAHKRGVKIVALLDDSNQTARYTGATFLQNAGIAVTIDARHTIAHNKIIILDSGTPSATVITGSFNFSKSAEESNAENLLVIKEAPDLVKIYDANFDAHQAHATPYVRKNANDAATTPPDAEPGDAPPATAPVTAPTATPPTTPATPATSAAGAKVNLNTATAKELEKLPGIGKAIAERIIEYRQQNGAFKSVEDLGKVKGIGKASMDKLRDLVTIQ